jgi:DNA-binding CsgD family transcriptional regulator
MTVKREIDSRTEKILALLLLHEMKGATQAEKAVQLSLAGFTAVEIADLLDTKAAVVHQHLYTMRKKKKK